MKKINSIWLKRRKSSGDMLSSIQYINGFSMFAMVPESGLLDCSFTSDIKCFLIAVTNDKVHEYMAEASATHVQEGSSPTHPVLKQDPSTLPTFTWQHHFSNSWTCQHWWGGRVLAQDSCRNGRRRRNIKQGGGGKFLQGGEEQLASGSEVTWMMLEAKLQLYWLFSPSQTFAKFSWLWRTTALPIFDQVCSD